ncbi:MAG TPA: NADP-dependent oxidoreductase [Candidatus Cybelea sp.]|jgi:NADPH:quinone reductase-like Zn-dependent oxidoreductase|nr:NADP-dependent oxidoreductase [Candidatus Cybelea sp.]
MRAAVIEHRGDRGELKEVPIPRPASHEILVRISAASVNPIDWKVRDGGERAMPFVLGQDFAGIVSATGQGVSKYHEGQRLFGIARDHGAYAEYTLVPDDDHSQPIAKIPDDVGDADAAALPTAGLTALAALDALGVKKDSLVVVLGATGGVGSFSVQIARDRGARVIGTARRSNEQLARSLGVDEFVAYDEQNVVEAIRTAHPQGVDAVLDLVDASGAIGAMAAALKTGGKIVSTIGAADVEWFSQRGLFALNIVMAETTASSHEGLRELLKMVERGAIRVMIGGERSLADVVGALDESKSGAVDGKLVLTVD